MLENMETIIKKFVDLIRLVLRGNALCRLALHMWSSAIHLNRSVTSFLAAAQTKQCWDLAG